MKTKTPISDEERTRILESITEADIQRYIKRRKAQKHYKIQAYLAMALLFYMLYKLIEPYL